MWKRATGRPRVAIVIAVCNEEESLPELAIKLERLHRQLEGAYRVEYCFVDDGSTDGTLALLPEVVPNGARVSVYSHDVNAGIGAAFRTAFSRSDADVICTIDADCSYPPEQLDAMICQVVAGQTDVVVASPYHPEGGVEGVQAWRIFLSLQCSRLYRIITPLPLHTYTSMFRAYRGSVAREVRFPSNGFVSTVEILLDAARRGHCISEQPLTLRKRARGRSKMRLVRTIREHLRLLARCAAARVHHGFPVFEEAPVLQRILSLPEDLPARANAFREKFSRLHPAVGQDRIS